jgi:hypothetical protein
MEELEEILKKWKADCAKAKSMDWESTATALHYKIQGFETALSKIKESCNTRMHVDTKPCDYCRQWEKISSYDHCPDCGRALCQ